MSFQVSPLSAKHFQSLFSATPEELASRQAIRMTVTKKPGFPCRVSLADAEVGEEVILVHFEHQSANSPFRASHAVFVRANAKEAATGVGEIPDMLRSRMLSLRGFDEGGMMLSAELADGHELEDAIEKMFLNPTIAYLHIHFAKPGCYAARVDRSSGSSQS